MQAAVARKTARHDEAEMRNRHVVAYALERLIGVRDAAMAADTAA